MSNPCCDFEAQGIDCDCPVESKSFPGIAAQLAQAKARIAELEAQAAVRPITMRTMKAAISKAIGVELSGGSYSYGCTVSRSDLEKIYAWVKARIES